MFGIVRPCRHRLRGPLFGQWMAHLCGLCLTLRDLHGQNARFVTNYDGLLVSVLTEAQNPAVTPHRTAGPCALRGFRRADVARRGRVGSAAGRDGVAGPGGGQGTRPHRGRRRRIRQADGRRGRGPVAATLAGGRRADWRRHRLRHRRADRRDRQASRSSSGRPGSSLLDVTEPTETAVSAAFAQTAVLAGQAVNAGPLADAGRHFGRIAHLVDAVEDLPGRPCRRLLQPAAGNGHEPSPRARGHCSTRSAASVPRSQKPSFAEPSLAESLLVREVGVAVDKVFADLAERARLRWRLA